jgi:uncharacterized OB-fold protein
MGLEAVAVTSPRPDLPVTDDATRRFWDAARQGTLVVVRCRPCGEPFFYPRPFCPHCWSQDVEWLEMSGRATLYTYSIVHQNDLPPFRDRVPYVAAIVDLDEGPRMMTNIVDCPFEDLKVGMKLMVRFEALSDEFALPMFRPVT